MLVKNHHGESPEKLPGESPPSRLAWALSGTAQVYLADNSGFQPCINVIHGVFENNSTGSQLNRVLLALWLH